MSAAAAAANDGEAQMCGPLPRGMWLAKATLGAVLTALLVGAAFAALGVLPQGWSWLLTFLWWYAGLGAIFQTTGTLIRAGTPAAQRRAGCEDRDLRAIVLVSRTAWRVLPLALLAGGRYGLAALVAYILVLGVARRVEDRRIRNEPPPGPVSTLLHRMVFAVAGALVVPLAPVRRLLEREVTEGMPLYGVLLVLLLLPIIVPLALVSLPVFAAIGIYRWVTSWSEVARRDRELVTAALTEGRLGWFAYSEPHQREHFLGEGGVLHDVADRFIQRDWRGDLAEARARAGRRDAPQDIDSIVLQRFRLSSLREDLPVAVFFQPDGGMRAVRLNRAYRQRFRDGGDLLASLEQALRRHIDEAEQPA